MRRVLIKSGRRITEGRLLKPRLFNPVAEPQPLSPVRFLGGGFAIWFMFFETVYIVRVGFDISRYGKESFNSGSQSPF